MLSLICLKTLILLVWFNTDAFIVYSKLFHVNKFFYINEWEEFKKTQDVTVTYHQFLRMKSPDGFWTKLITCPICLCVWLCIPTALLCGFGYTCVVCVFSLLLYYLIVKLS